MTQRIYNQFVSSIFCSSSLCVALKVLTCLRHFDNVPILKMRTQLPPISFLKSAGLAILVVAASLSARADNTLVDTGPSPYDYGWLLGGGGSYSYSQNLAARFTLSQDVTVTSIEGYIASFNSDYLRIAITDNSNGTIPGAQVWADNVLLNGDSVTAWQGFTNLNLFLSAGTYWVAFIGSPSLNASMPSSVPNPTDVEAFTYVGSGQWFESDNLDVGVRIKGNTVPDGASVLGLMGLALGAMVVARRRLS